MITDQDVEKLKGTFVTKEDAMSFATKEDLKGYARQESLDALSVKVGGIQEQLGDLKVEVGELHDRFDAFEGRFDTLEVKFDSMLDLLTGSMQEHTIGAAQYARHDRQIGALAVATGVTLPD